MYPSSEAHWRRSLQMDFTITSRLPASDGSDQQSFSISNLFLIFLSLTPPFLSSLLTDDLNSYPQRKLKPASGKSFFFALFFFLPRLQISLVSILAIFALVNRSSLSTYPRPVPLLLCLDPISVIASEIFFLFYYTFLSQQIFLIEL